MLQDLRYAVRMLLKQPGFTLIAVLTLSLGLGATIAIFNVVNAVFWQPLPFRNPDRLVIVWETIPRIGLTENTPAPANYLSWREQNQSFERLAAWQIQLANLTGSGEPEQITGQKVSADFFPILGVEPTLGRWFLPEEDQPGTNPVVMISHDLWQRRFGGDPQIIGRKLTLSNSSREVIGVMPQAFEDPIPTADYRAQFWVPLALPQEAKQNRSRSLFLIGQLKRDVTAALAQREMETLVKRLQADDRILGDGFGVNVQLLLAQRALRVRQALWILLAAAAFVLLIGCVNVANLLLVRASWRWRETAIRTALGAGRWRLTRQFVTESILLGCIGGIAGLVISLWGVSLLTARMPDDLTAARVVSIDWRVLCFTFFASVLSGLACGLAPALQSFRPNLNEALKEGGRNSSSGTGRLRGGLVVAQLALTLILLIGAGLMLNSFWRLSRVGMGFEPANLLTLRVSLSGS
jgi:putative ABC transport system permease protein